MMRFRSVVAGLLLAAAAVFVAQGAAQAHGQGKAEHGGVLQVVGETTLELVTPRNGGVELWIETEGQEVSTEGMSARLVITANKQKSEATLLPAGENKLAAKDLRIPRGARVSAQVTLKDGQTKVGATFTAK